MPTYTAWPTTADVRATLDAGGIELRSAIDESYIQRKLDAVTDRVARLTHRQFVAASATRYFDGSGTGTQDIDECVSLTEVSVIGYTTATAAVIANVMLRTDNTYPSTIMEIYQGSSPGIGFVYMTAFPIGRQNIKVTANWGYAAAIPKDLWESVAGEAAAIIAGESIYNSDGRVERWTEADVTEALKLELPGDAARWHSEFEASMRLYKRPLDRNLRKWKPVMI